MEDKLTLGEKIKKFRKRAELSQFKLEILIDAAPGSISRIENGEVNPSKETLLKIGQALKLTPNEIAALFDLEIHDRGIALAKATKALNTSLDKNKILQSSVNDIVFELDLLAAYVTVVKGNKLYGHTSTENWATKIAEPFFPKKLTELNIDLEQSSQNLMVRTVLDKKSYYRERFIDFAVPVISLPIALIIEKTLGVKSSISFPIVIESNIIGAILFAKNKIDDFSKERSLLEYFTENIAQALVNAYKYQELINQINILKNGQ